MINPATQPAPSYDQFNEFTQFLVDNPNTVVVLRNGTLVQPKLFYENGKPDTFQTGLDDQHCWSLNGESIVRDEWDMMKTLKEQTKNKHYTSVKHHYTGKLK